MTLEDDAVVHGGLVHAVGRSMGVFYVEDVRVGSRDPE